MIVGCCFSLIKNYKAKWGGKVWEESVDLMYGILLPVSLSSTITKESTHLKIKRFEFCVALTPPCWAMNKGYEYAPLDFWKVPLWPRLPSNFLCSWRWPWTPDSLASIPFWDYKECTIGLRGPQILSQMTGMTRTYHFAIPFYTFNFGLCFLNVPLGARILRSENSRANPPTTKYHHPCSCCGLFNCLKRKSFCSLWSNNISSCFIKK